MPSLEHEELARDEDKRHAWPFYVAAVRARYRSRRAEGNPAELLGAFLASPVVPAA